MKLLQLKGLNWSLEPIDSQVIQGSSIESIPKTWTNISFSYGLSVDLGHLLLSDSLTSELIHKVLGGSDDVLPLAKEKELTSLEKKSLESLNSTWTLSLREALTPFLKLEDCKVSRPIQFSEMKTLAPSYFYERFKVEGLLSGELHVFFKTSAFQK